MEHITPCTCQIAIELGHMILTNNLPIKVSPNLTEGIYMNNYNLETQLWTPLCRSHPPPRNNHRPAHICLILAIVDAPSRGVCNWGIASLKEEASRPPTGDESIVECMKRAMVWPKMGRSSEWSMPWLMTHEQSLISLMYAFSITGLTQSLLC